jgi:hypothetical protein
MSFGFAVGPTVQWTFSGLAGRRRRSGSASKIASSRPYGYQSRVTRLSNSNSKPFRPVPRACGRADFHKRLKKRQKRFLLAVAIQNAGRKGQGQGQGVWCEASGFDCRYSCPCRVFVFRSRVTKRFWLRWLSARRPDDRWLHESSVDAEAAFSMGRCACAGLVAVGVLARWRACRVSASPNVRKIIYVTLGAGRTQSARR